MGVFRRRALVLALLVLVPLLGIALYYWAGSRDASRAEIQAALPPGSDFGINAENDIGRLRSHLERQPRDARGWIILARLLADANRFEESARAYDKGLAASPKVAADAAVWCEYADALGMAQGGNLAGRPRELIDRALALSPNHPKALEMAGSSEYENGNYATALRYWRPLLAVHRPGSEAHAELAAAIARTERLAATAPAPKMR